MDWFKKENFETNDGYVFHVLLRYLYLHMFFYFNRYNTPDTGTITTLFRLPMLDMFFYLESAQEQVKDKPFKDFLSKTLQEIKEKSQDNRITVSPDTYKKMANRVLLEQDDLFQNVMVAYAPASSDYVSQKTQYYFRPNLYGLTESSLTRDTLLLPTLFSGGKSIVMRVEKTDASLPNYWQWVYAFTRYYMAHANTIPASDLLSHVFDTIGKNALPLSPIDVGNLMRGSLYNKKRFSIPFSNLLAIASTNYYVFWKDDISSDKYEYPLYLKEKYIFDIEDLCCTFDDSFLFAYLSFIEKQLSINLKEDLKEKDGEEKRNIYTYLQGPLLRLLLNSYNKNKMSRDEDAMRYMAKGDPEDMYMANIGMSLEAEDKPVIDDKKKKKTAPSEDDNSEEDNDNDEDADKEDTNDDEESEKPEDKEENTSEPNKDDSKDDGEKPALFENDEEETPDTSGDGNDNEPSGRNDEDNTIDEDSSGSSSPEEDTPEENTSKITAIDMDKTQDKDNAFLYRQAVQSMYERLYKQADDDGCVISPEDLNTLGLWCNQWLWLASVAATKNLVSELGLQKILDKSLKF